ncbi:MAG: conjugal transfer protein TraF (plasmid) [Candidatus Algichlamydia australiensis]|nr:conjugal transfer protein TraF [Chlamydiales bacterium]
MKTKISILVFLYFRILVANDSWYDQKLEGWYYYENPAKQKAKKQDELTPEKAQKIIEAGKIQLEQLLSKAILDPTTENVEKYMQKQRQWIDQNAKFANTWGRVLLYNPSLGDFLTNPTTSYGINAKREFDLNKRKNLLSHLSKDHFLLFVFKGEEFYSKQAALVAHHFGETNNWKVQGLSLDGESLDIFPSPIIDHGLAKEIYCDTSPAFYVVEPYENKVMPVGAGLISVTQLEQNIEFQCTRN